MLSSIIILTVYFVVYAITHSWLVSASVKNWARRIFGPAVDRWYRLGYNLIAIAALVPMLLMMVWLPSQTLYVAPPPWRWLMLAGQLLAVMAAGVSLWQTDPFYFAGLAQLVAKKPAKSGSLKVNGFYAWVRHPLYSFSLVFLWLTPAMTSNTLTAYILFTLYFYVGSIYEERRLIAEFGASYEAYRRQVPRLIPRPGRRYELPP